MNPDDGQDSIQAGNSSSSVKYFTDGHNAGIIADPLSDASRLVGPTVSICEVLRMVLRGTARTPDESAIA